jgi:hypothetical protein
MTGMRCLDISGEGDPEKNQQGSSRSTAIHNNAATNEWATIMARRGMSSQSIYLETCLDVEGERLRLGHDVQRL